MKSLSLPKPLIIILVGLPGAGKSFFARQFSETFGAPIVSYDRLRYELFSKPTYSKDEQDILSRVGSYQLGEILKTKQTCILDGEGAARVDRMRIGKLAREAGYGVLIVWVQTDEITAKQRATRRSKQKLEDIYSNTLTSDQYDTLVKKFTPPNHSESYLVISGKHTYAAQVRVLLKKLAQPRERAAEVAPPERKPPTQNRRQNVIIR